MTRPALRCAMVLSLLVLCLAGTAAARPSPDAGVAWTVPVDGPVRAAAPTDGGGVVVAGGTDAGTLTRIDANGSVVWRRTFETPREGGFHGVARVEGGYVAAGVADTRVADFRPGTGWLVKVAPDGTVLWNRTYGRAIFHDVAAANDGRGAVAVGYAYDERPRAVAVGPDGSVRWRSRYGRAGDILLGIAPADDENGYVLVGSSARDGLLGGWAVGVNATGGVAWEHVDDYPDFDRYEDVAPRPQGGYVVARQAEQFTVLAGNGSVVAEPDVTFGGDIVGLAVTPDRKPVFVAGFVKASTGFVARVDGDRVGDVRTYSGRIRDLVPLGNRTYAAVGGGVVRRLDWVRPTGATLTANRTVTNTTSAVRLAASATDNDRIAAYGWDFDGDGSVDRTTVAPVVTHRYAATGNVTTRVTARDQAGNGVNATVDLRVRDETPPTARLRADPAVPGDSRGAATAVGEPTVLVASNTTDGGTVVEYRWDTDGDGTPDRTTTEPVITVRHYRTGDVTVSVTAVDGGGNTDTATALVRVRQNDVPELTVRTNASGRPGPVRFTANVSDEVGGDVRVVWSFESGERSGPTVVERLGPGEHVVYVTAVDPYGARNLTTVEVDLGSTPTASPSPAPAGESVTSSPGQSTTEPASSGVTEPPSATPTGTAAPPASESATDGPGMGVPAALVALAAAVVGLLAPRAR